MTDKELSPSSALTIKELGLKYKTEEELFDMLMQAGETWRDDEKDMVHAAYNLAAILHADDKHKDLPYIYHLLRNAARVTGYLHINDSEIVTAVILHDSVEDHPDDILTVSMFGQSQPPIDVPVPQDGVVKQQVALKTLEALFTARVAQLVAAVTNPPASEAEGLSYEDWMDQYAQKVKKAVETPGGWVVKFVDWEDNGLGIVHTDEALSPQKVRHFSRKYATVQPILEDRYRQPDVQAMLDDQAKAYAAHQFQLGRERLAIDA